MGPAHTALKGVNGKRLMILMKTSRDQLHSVESHTIPAAAEDDCKHWLNRCHFLALRIKNRVQGILAEIQIAVVGGAAFRESVDLYHSIAKRLPVVVGESRLIKPGCLKMIILEGGNVKQGFHIHAEDGTVDQLSQVGITLLWASRID
jgi:hypothetical protein